MKKFLTTFLIYSQFFILFTTIILSAIFYNSFNEKFYYSFYQKNNIANNLGLTETELFNYIKNLLLYLEDSTALNKNWYTEKDILHMIDVKNLYTFFYNLNIIFIIIFLITNFILFFILKKNYLHTLINKFQGIFLTFCAFLLTLTAVIAYNFNYFWMKFHEILFSNDLWLLSPRESNLIKMFPEDFFFTLVTKIILTIAVSYLILFILKIILKKLLKF